MEGGGLGEAITSPSLHGSSAEQSRKGQALKLPRVGEGGGSELRDGLPRRNQPRDTLLFATLTLAEALQAPGTCRPGSGGQEWGQKLSPEHLEPWAWVLLAPKTFMPVRTPHPL